MKEDEEEIQDIPIGKTNEPEDIPIVKIKDAKKDFETMVSYFLSTNPITKTNNKTNELEVRFGTNPRKFHTISKQDYDNTVSQLLAAGFMTDLYAGEDEGLHILRINNQYTNTKTGGIVMSNIRAEIVGLDLIQDYCKSNSIQKLIDNPTNANKIKFTQKTPPAPPNLRSVDFYDFNFRVSHQMEEDYTPGSNVAKSIISKWSDSKKTFRYLNRVRFWHPEYPIFADISIVRGSMTARGGRVPIPKYTIQEAEVFTNQETYEIELEIDNKKVGPGTSYNTPKKLLDVLKKTIRIVLSGLQKTQYPISFTERDQVLQSYIKLLHGPEEGPKILESRLKAKDGFRIYNKDFTGPSSYTLQIENIANESPDSTVPNIRKNYCVTDKADGERRLLFINEHGRIYTIDTNMNVIFTGLQTTEKGVYDTLLDGEFIKLNKKGEICNIYAAFDIYFIREKSVREKAFMYGDPEVKATGLSSGLEEGEIPENDEDFIPDETNYRLSLLQKVVSLLKPISIKNDKDSPPATTDNRACGFTIQCKQFVYLPSIFEACSNILTKVNDAIYDYNTDGLIFTPINTGVGSNRVNSAGPLFKTTWAQSFKWKPPEFNTIDFLVSVKKNKNGQDEIHNIFQEGKNLQGHANVIQYKTLELMCGFNADEHVYKNPWLDIINDKIPTPSSTELENTQKYEPKLFIPTNPFDANACYCNVLLQTNENNQQVMMTEEKEYFESDTIIECKYDVTKEGAWKWIPLRVRHDKTFELRTRKNNFGNAYHVANSNWTSIHNPITFAMITTGENIPDTLINQDVYYNRSSKETSTLALRNFHNLYVKRKLIMGVSNRKDTLIDYAVGKGGDLNKWVDAKLGFVYGIDISRDNIHNNLDGACARYLNLRRKHNNKFITHALFSHGNSGLNIRKKGDAFTAEKDREICKAIFGNGSKDKQVLGEGVYRQYGIAKEGFNISSVQFALHYFFETNLTLHHFIRNVSDCTCVGGYFIGTCYDGKTVFEMLKSKNEGESITIMKDMKKMYEITKRYAQTGFPDDEMSIGYAVDIYQETINKVAREYLVNYEYLIRIMENYGFVPLSKEEANRMGFPKSSGLFTELFHSMEYEIQTNRLDQANYGNAPFMSMEEKRISFMNRYFIFKKKYNVNTETIFKTFERKHRGMIDDDSNSDDSDSESHSKKNEKDEKDEMKIEDHIQVPAKIVRIKRKLTVPKIVIQEYEPLIDPNSIENDDENTNANTTTAPVTVVFKRSKISKK